MPLIVITGMPSSGKTARSLELKSYFEERLKSVGQSVKIISELDAITKAGYDKNTFYEDSKKEKAVRSDLKSNIHRGLDPRDLLIFDGSNYIKGYRYEIYCMTKLCKTPQCTVYCDMPVEHAWLWNDKRAEPERYNRKIFDELVARYETPNSKNRWDAPLFAVSPEDTLMYDEIYNSLYEVKLPKPNKSTQNAPLASTDYLYMLDKITLDVTNAILIARNKEVRYQVEKIPIDIPGSNTTVQTTCTAAQLQVLRRRFLIYSKKQQIEIDKIATLFVHYLNSYP
ncbi:protein KTI12 homolog [Pseudomyrmex gracilis]|uniref:protein KTI12 homolog n=1 Tax=Pseudomyrmex gracilis TaxID=219809 RepID=UPI000995B628|nr:protein KTI12 homolog [Pseudomyrmex gracilis]XP_020278483.1 protein KTI12 homolog [Pseudomyrmex gracilis]XP_020278484.1 protein KTI12 homolog [Pseudomyrmex gracilis]